MREAVIFAIAGYLCGSVLFARLAIWLFRRPDIIKSSKDENPGAANAFQYGGVFCGIFVLCGDLLKGFLPVYGYQIIRETGEAPLLLALVLAAPVIGHAFPIFFRFRGGKGIAVTFGCLLGLFPVCLPVAIFALLFIFFSVVLRIKPHFYRTIVTYIATALGLVFFRPVPGVLLGFCLITGVVLLRLSMSREERPKPEVKLLWMR